MSGGGTQQGIPTTNQPFVDKNAKITQVWRQFLNALWQRTGGSAGGGPVNTTGSPVSGNIAIFSGSTNITNGNLTGDVTTSGGVATTIKNSVALAGNPTAATQAAGNNTTRLANTAFVTAALSTAQATRSDVAVNFSGVPSASQQFNFVTGRPFTLPINLASPASQAHIGTNPTSTLTLTLKKNGSSIGTIAFSAAGAATISFTSAVSFSAGDVLTVTCPASPDATGANIALALLGTLN